MPFLARRCQRSGKKRLHLRFSRPLGITTMGLDILNIVPNKPAIHVVDVGAMFLGARNLHYGSLVKAGLAKIVGFEPVAAECDKLNAMAGAGCIYLPYAIGDGSKGTFRICN